MCGVVGIFKDMEKPITEQEYMDFLDMLVEAEARGKQATGVAYLRKDGKIFSIKGPTMATRASEIIPFRKNMIAMIGHTRASTGGSPHENKNNHPHESKNWILIHNGMCNSSISKSLLDLKTSCDTEEFVATFEHVSKDPKLGGATLITQVLEGLNNMSGNWTLAFFHKKDGRMFLTTNGGSPLAVYKYIGGTYFASLPAYIEGTILYKTINKAEEVACTIVKDWDGTSPINDNTMVSPSSDLLFEINSKGLPIPVGRYTHNSRIYNYGYPVKGGHHSYYGNQKDMGFGEEEETYYGANSTNSNPKITTSKSKKIASTPQEIDTFFRMNTPYFDFNLDEVILNSKLYTSFVPKVAQANYASRLISLGIVKGGYKNERKNKKIGKMLEKSFKDIVQQCVQYEMALGTDMNTDIPDNMAKYFSTKGTPKETFVNKFTWYEKIIVIHHGLEFMGAFTYGLDYSVGDQLNDPDYFEIDTLEDSEFACNSCNVHCKVLKYCNSYVSYICPVCYTEIAKTCTN